MNPWGLTATQEKVMDAMCTHGSHKLAARMLGLSVKTTQQHTHAAGTKIGGRATMLKYLTWDRWRRTGVHVAEAKGAVR